MHPYNFALVILLVTPLLWFIHNRHSKRHRKLPPGPRGLPIIGSLHLLGKLPNRTLHNLAKKHGPIMSMYLGNVLTIVVSSPQAAEKFLKTHDLVFASRPIIQASEYVSYGSKGVVSSVYGPYWRHARKFCTLELLSVKKIDSFVERRREELVLMVKSVKEAAKGSEVVDVSDMVGRLLENMTYKMLFGRSNDERFDLKGIIRQLLDQAGAFNLADFIPILGPFDLQGLTRLIKARHRSADKILEIIINEHEAAFSSTKKDDVGVDFVDTLLSLLHNKRDTVHGELSRVIDRASIKAIIIDMISAAIDTSHTAIEWAMTELIRHPRIMQKLHAEIEGVVGDQEIVEEVDLSKLNYLDLVIKENFRLHPVIPFLIPRESMEDIEVNGYYIPKGSRVLINSWALGRDSDVWLENVEEFLPERFSCNNIEIKGHDFRLLPFGSGRRVCPGINLGLINVKQIVAQLVRTFDWELPNGMSVEDLDMDEKFGLSLPRQNHLKAVPILRL